MLFLVQHMDKMAMQRMNIVKGVGLQFDKSEMMRDRGRRLKYNAVTCILRGQGSFEYETTPPAPVTQGTFFYLYSNRWHKFGRLKDTAKIQMAIGRVLAKLEQGLQKAKTNSPRIVLKQGTQGGGGQGQRKAQDTEERIVHE